MFRVLVRLSVRPRTTELDESGVSKNGKEKKKIRNSKENDVVTARRDPHYILTH